MKAGHFPVKPRRLGLPRLLVVGCGDTGLHILERIASKRRVFALTSNPERLAELRAAGAVPLLGNLDHARQLSRLRGLASEILMLAPPPAQGSTDPRSKHLASLLRRPANGYRLAGRALSPSARPSLRAIRQGLIVAKRGNSGPQLGWAARPVKLVYASTTGVYGDAQGAWLSEAASPQPQSDRAKRRVAAETLWRQIGPARARQANLDLAPWRTTVLRIPGIYGAHRLPLERLRRGLPRLNAVEDVYTNHIEIGDLANTVIAALQRGQAQRIIHACDGQELKMGDYFDAVAEAAGLPRPPSLTAQEMQTSVSPAMWSFMRESRRLDNSRLCKELRVRLRFPTVQSALQAWFGTRSGEPDDTNRQEKKDQTR